jgi:pimeloyl-ACP methyl ester carboxylesterase
MHPIRNLLALLFLPASLFAQVAGFHSDTTSVPVYGGRLYGTLLHPSTNAYAPVVLIIAGSGPTDRDGNNPMGGNNNSLLQLATELAEKGIASLRYDKRGIGQSIKSLQREQSLVFEQNSADAIVWLEWLHEHGYRKIYIAGHSEGSLVGLVAAQQWPISGFISLAGAGRPIGDVLREQLNSLPDPLKEKAYAYLDTLDNGKKIAEPLPALFSLFRPAIQDYMISWMKLDPATLISKLTIPTIIVQGGHDLQVKTADAKRLSEANPRAELFLIPDMNHVFKPVRSEDPMENLKTYKDPNLPIHPQLIPRIAAFIRS